MIQNILNFYQNNPEQIGHIALALMFVLSVLLIIREISGGKKVYTQEELQKLPEEKQVEKVAQILETRYEEKKPSQEEDLNRYGRFKISTVGKNGIQTKTKVGDLQSILNSTKNLVSYREIK